MEERGTRHTSLNVLKGRRYRLLKAPTDAEIALYHRLSGGRVRFQFQVLIAPYIVDFVIPRQMLVLEVDGGIHKSQRDYDDRRTRYLESCGFKVIRIMNEDVPTWPLKTLRRFPLRKNAYSRALSAAKKRWKAFTSNAYPPYEVVRSPYMRAGQKPKQQSKQQSKKALRPKLYALYPCTVCGRELMANRKGRLVRHRLNGFICPGAFKQVKDPHPGRTSYDHQTGR